MRFTEPPELRDVPADYQPLIGDAVRINGVLHAWVPGIGWCDNETVFVVEKSS